MKSQENSFFLGCLCLDAKKRRLIRAILWDFSQKTSHEISFSSDGINISSLRILKMSDKIASTCDDCRFFLPKSLIGDKKVDYIVPRIKKTRTIFRSQI